MASEYNSSRFYAHNHNHNHNNNNNNNNGTFDSYAFRGIRSSGSFRTKACGDRMTTAISFPTVKIKSNLSNRNYGTTATAATESNNNNKSYYSSTKSFASKTKLPTTTATKPITTITNYNYNNSNSTNMNGSNSRSKTNLSATAKAVTSNTGISTTEWNTPKTNSMNGSSKRIYSSMRITKKEMPYLTPTNVTLNSITSNRCTNWKDKFDVFYKRQTTYRNDNNNDSMNHNSSSSSHSNTSNSNRYAFQAQKSSTNSVASKPTHYFSSEFPNGLPFEDEFYHKKRQKSVSSTSKSERSDYGSIDNDSDQSLLPFEEEFSRQRPSIEALYVDFSKPITTTTSYSKSTNNDFSSSNCSSNSSSCLNINKSHNEYDYSCKNYVCNPDEVIVQDQPVVYVAVQWCSNHSNLNNHNTNRMNTM